MLALVSRYDNLTTSSYSFDLYKMFLNNSDTDSTDGDSWYSVLHTDKVINITSTMTLNSVAVD